MPSHYPPYSVERKSHSGRRRHPRNNPRPFAREQNNSGRWPKLRTHFVAAGGEFAGTTMFLFFAFGGTQVAVMTSTNNVTDPQKILFISLSFGFSLAVNAWVFYRISGGLFNPAVSEYRTSSASCYCQNLEES